jgi:two-component system, NarL family, sensor kinase
MRIIRIVLVTIIFLLRQFLSAETINPVSVNGSANFNPRQNYGTLKFWEDNGSFPRTFDYKIPNLSPNDMIFLSPLNRNDTILLSTSDGSNVRFKIVAIQLFEWAIVPIDVNSEIPDNTLLLKVRRKFNSEVGILPLVKCRVLEFERFTSEIQKNRLDRGWMLGSTLFLVFLSVLFAIAVRNSLIIKFAEISFAIFLIVLFNESNILQNQLEFFHPILLFLNGLILWVGFRYTDYAQSLKKGFGDYTLNWRVIILGLSLLVAVNFVFREVVWLGILVLTLEVIATFILLFLYIYHTYYFKWYNQFILILLTLTSEFVIVTQYFNDRELGLHLTEILILELIIAAVFTARVIVWEFEENHKMMEQNLKIQQQLGLIQMESVENERKRIVQELQDDILFKINGLEKSIRNESNGDSFFKQLDKTLKSLRKYTYQLYPPHLQQLHLVDIFQREIEIMTSEERHIDFVYEGYAYYDFPFETKSNLYRIFQQFLKYRNWKNQDPQVRVYCVEKENCYKWTFSTNASRANENYFSTNQTIDLYLKILNATFHSSLDGNTWELEIPRVPISSHGSSNMVLLVLLMLFSGNAFSGNDNSSIPPKTNLNVLVDDNQVVEIKPKIILPFKKQITVDSFRNRLKSLKHQSQFQTSTKISEHWFYYPIRVPKVLGNRVISIPDYQINHLELYMKHPLGHIQRIVNFGDEISVQDFNMNTRTAQAQYSFQDTGLYELFIRHNRSGMQPKLLIRVSKIDDFIEHWNQFEWLYGVIYGFIISYLVFIFWGFISTKEISYGFFFLWVFMNFMHNFISSGHLKYWFIQGEENWFSSLRLAAAIFGAYAINQYALFHYRQKDRLAWLYKLSNFLALFLLAVLISVFFFKAPFYLGFERIAVIVIRLIIGLFLLVQIYLPIRHFIQYKEITYLSWVLGVGIINGFGFIYQTGKIEPVDFDNYSVFTNLIFVVEVIVVAWGSVKYTLSIQSERSHLIDQNIQLQKEINQRQNDVQEKERMRIAMELHDDVLNRMSILMLLARDKYIDKAEIAKNLQEIGRDIKHYILGLYPYWTKEAELNQVIFNNLNEISAKLKIQLTIQADEKKLNFSKLQKLQLFRLAQEFIQNAGKHGKATRVIFNIIADGSQFYLEFKDNGVGFDPEQSVQGLGTQGAKQRIQTLAGSMKIETAMGKGVRWIITIPKFSSLQTLTPMS